MIQDYPKLLRDKNLQIKILHEDEFFVIAYKPSGMLSVPGRGEDKQDCVASRVRQLYPDCIQQPSVHRLDMDTSGLLVMALTSEAHKILSRQFEQRIVKKRYVALLDGSLEESKGHEGEIQLAFRLDVDNRPHQIYDAEHGKMGQTLWRIIEKTAEHTKVEFTPITGRTHQLRVHSAHELGMNLPIMGDPLYGNGQEAGELKLHAEFLSFLHPLSDEWLEFSCDADF
ncbi:MAG: RluA family pseudouridine synthase [Lentisphaeraceae bacterium]|nr:RluA family pseudouridine synthase [Lentisphaeraceae bacterium]